MIVKPLRNIWNRLLKADGPVFKAGDWVTKKLIGDHRNSGSGRAAALQGGHGGQIPTQAVNPPQTLDSLRPVMAAAAVRDGSGKRGSKGTILFVDDQPSDRTITKGILERAGYTVLVANSRLEALEILSERKGEIDIVVTDVKMADPEKKQDMSGVVLAEQVRSRFPELPVIIVTGFSRDEVYSGALNAGVVHYMEKPLDFTALVAELGALMKEKSAREERKPVIQENLHAFRESLREALADSQRSAVAEQRLRLAQDQTRELLAPPKLLVREEFNLVQHVKVMVKSMSEVTFIPAEETIMASLDKNQFLKSIISFLYIARRAVARRGAGRHIDVAIGRNVDRIMIVIKDNGLRDENLSLSALEQDLSSTGKIRLFEDYLSMALASRYVRDHGGEIEIESDKDKGTTVTLKYPLK